MATAKTANVIVETLASIGVKRVYGVPGDSLNGITDAIRTHESIAGIHMRNEEAAAFAAGAEAHLTGNLAVCAGSCGPGNTHLINGLYDCHRNRVPVLAIAAQVPSKEVGSDYFQETKPDQIFKDCSNDPLGRRRETLECAILYVGPRSAVRRNRFQDFRRGKSLR